MGSLVLRFGFNLADVGNCRNAKPISGFFLCVISYLFELHYFNRPITNWCGRLHNTVELVVALMIVSHHLLQHLLNNCHSK